MIEGAGTRGSPGDALISRRFKKRTRFATCAVGRAKQRRVFHSRLRRRSTPQGGLPRLSECDQWRPWARAELPVDGLPLVITTDGGVRTRVLHRALDRHCRRRRALPCTDRSTPDQRGTLRRTEPPDPLSEKSAITAPYSSARKGGYPNCRFSQRRERPCRPSCQ